MEELAKIQADLEQCRRHSDIETELMDCQRHHRAWINFGIVASVYALGMTILFAWVVRL